MDEGGFSVSAQFRVAPLFCRPWTLNGISPRLIESHYEHNYGAALTRLNAVTRELEGIDFGTVNGNTFAVRDNNTGQFLGATYTASADNRVVTFVPSVAQRVWLASWEAALPSGFLPFITTR